MKKLIKDFVSSEVKMDNVTGGAREATGDTCSNNTPDDCDVEAMPVIIVKGGK